jgi:hypothetical protein
MSSEPTGVRERWAKRADIGRAQILVNSYQNARRHISDDSLLCRLCQENLIYYVFKMGPLFCVFIKNLNAVNMVILLYILKQAGISLPTLFTLQRHIAPRSGYGLLHHKYLW